jgi:hypothetical protein
MCFGPFSANVVPLQHTQQQRTGGYISRHLAKNEHTAHRPTGVLMVMNMQAKLHGGCKHYTCLTAHTITAARSCLLTRQVSELQLLRTKWQAARIPEFASPRSVYLYFEFPTSPVLEGLHCTGAASEAA